MTRPIVFCQLALATCLSIAPKTGLAENGIVLDTTTGKPIPHAIVVATWHGVVAYLVQRTSQCFQVEVATADDKGRFEVSSYSGNVNPLMTDRQRILTVFASGFHVSRDWQPTDLRVLMEPQTGSKSEQFKRLPGTQAMGCKGADKVMLPYLTALHKEMTPLASTVDEKLEAAQVLFHIDVTEMGVDAALRKLGPREGAIRRGEQ